MARVRPGRAVAGRSAPLSKSSSRGFHGQAGPIRVEGERWAWALPMRSLGGAFGHVVIAGEAPVQDTEQFLLRVLAQQLGMAIATRMCMPVSVRPPRRLGS